MMRTDVCTQFVVITIISLFGIGSCVTYWRETFKFHLANGCTLIAYSLLYMFFKAIKIVELKF